MARHADKASTDETTVSEEDRAGGGFFHRRDDEEGYAQDEGVRGGTTYAEPALDRGPTVTPEGHAAAREKFGGVNWGASFFGWLVAVALAVLLTSIAGAIAAGVGASTEITQSDAEREAGTIGVVAAVVLLVVLLVGYYTGGYVAGRMSRFDGARQGFGVWAVGLLVTIVAVVLGAVFGRQYNILDRVDLPRVPFSTDQLGWETLVTGLVVLFGTLLVAMLGGAVGHRYHNRVDRVVHD
jgi:amino acid transporter